MSSLGSVMLAAVALVAAGCSPSTSKESGAASPAVAAPARGGPRITQLYASAPAVAKGEKSLLCYGVENAKSVWLSPPRQELSAAISRCVEVMPAESTRYTLTAEGDGGPPATQSVTVAVGPPKVKIVDVTISSLAVKPGDLVSICFHARNAAAVRIDPLNFRSSKPDEGCTTDVPKKTTTYVVTAVGVGGDRDQEHVTVTVK